MDDPEPLRLPADRTAPRLARRHVTAAGIRAGWLPELVDRALLIASELVTNAILHGRAPAEITVRTLPSAVRIEVSDGGAGAPVLPDHKPRSSATSGRGVFLLDQLADRWGCHPRTPGPGKTVWAELDGHGITFPAGSATGRGSPTG